jgi:superfamily II DNA or RNA helicase
MGDVVVRIRNVDMLIEGDLPKDLRDEIRSVMSYVVPNFKYMPSYKRGGPSGWDGTRTVALYVKGLPWLNAPSGLLSYLREILDNRGVPYVLVDERKPALTSPGWATDGLTLRDYQVTVVDEILRRQRGVLKAATGGGKTKIMIEAITRAASFPAIFYVTTCDLLEQAYDEFTKHVRCDGQPVKIGRIGAGHCDLKPITIATVQSCQRALEGKYTKFDDESPDDKTAFSESQKKDIVDFVRDAQFVYVDEAHHVAAETIQSILNYSHMARFRIGGSASPWRDDGLDLLIEAVFGRRLCDISASFLIQRGYLLKPYITFNHFRQSLGPASTFNAHYTKYVVENLPRNEWIAQRAQFHVERGRPTIILVKWIKHADILADMIPGAERLIGTIDPKIRKEKLNDMRARKLMCIIGTSLLDEGVDVPAAGTGIFAGGGKSSTRELQRVGRFIRPDPADPDKECAYIEEFYDHSKWLMNHAKARRRILETEKEFEIGDNRATLAE